MSGLTLQIVIGACASGALGMSLGWLIKARLCDLRLQQLGEDWQAKVDDVTRQRDRLQTEITALRTQFADLQATARKHNIVSAQAKTELDSAREREKQLSRDLFTLRNERDEFKGKAGMYQNALFALKQHNTDLAAEFAKSRDLLKGELENAFEKRSDLEAQLANARLEHESFSNLLQASRAEYESVNKMLVSAKARLQNLDDLERNVIRLEAENAQLNHDSKLAQQENDALRRDIAEIDELKVQNQELAHCLESIENSRQQYENDAKRYRDHADLAERKSATLRVRLDEVEKSFAEIETQQQKALRDARTAATAPKTNGQTPPAEEIDNLQEIVGIGKVFERALHDLGIRSFRQIAAFGAADIARINRELKECKGRLEQDDWIGQAKDLLYKKYSTAGQ